MGRIEDRVDVASRWLVGDCCITQGAPAWYSVMTECLDMGGGKEDSEEGYV